MNYQPKFGKNDQRSKCYIFRKKQRKLIIATMTRHIKLSSHKYFHIIIIPVTSLDIVIPGLELFGFVLLYYLVCGVCSDMLTCLLYIMIDFFLTIKITNNIDQLE